ncbi:MAG: presqualene diphosphate synthase HpnD, partial [Gammaproteobacteria bacterium]|nr:presqualene diphosphate synthase HpnD [Gammaproteobacteria bacterium]
MPPDHSCKQKTRASGSSFLPAFLLLTPQKRRALNALYAFCREVDDIVDNPATTPAAAGAALQQWREEVSALFHGSAKHPVSRALAPLCHDFRLEESLLLEIINGMAMDLIPQPYTTFNDLQHYCYRVAGVVGLLSARIFGFYDNATETYAVELGTALQLTNIIRDVREDAARGRCYLPLDELAKFGLQRDNWLTPENAPQLQQLLQLQAQRATAYYQRAFAALPKADRPQQLSGIVMGALYYRLLQKRPQQAVGLNHPERLRLSRSEKLTTLLTTLWQERRGSGFAPKNAT